MFIRYFTLEEALALLPLVREGCERIRGLLQEQEQVREQMEQTWREDDSGAAAAGPEEERSRLASLGEAVGEELHRIHTLGAQVKGLDPFLVDFPARREGEHVLLCWQEGEAGIGHFHTLEGGAAARVAIEHAEDFGCPVRQ